MVRLRPFVSSEGLHDINAPLSFADTMDKGKKDYLEKRIEKLKAENRSLRERLTTIKDENIQIRKRLTSRNRIFDSLPAGIILLQDGKIIDINGHVAERLNYSHEEVRDRPFPDLLHPDTVRFMKELQAKRISVNISPLQTEFNLIMKNGQHLCFDARIKKITFNGRRAFLATLIGIDESRKKEERNITAKKREALSTMASCLNRELMLSVKDIDGKIENLKSLLDSDGRGIKVCLEDIDSATRRVESLSKKLEAISTVEIDPSDRELLDLKSVLRSAVTAASSCIKGLTENRKEKLNLKTYMRSVSPIEGHSEEIRDVIMNMILNAAEAMPDGGDIYITTEENAGYAHIYIQDSGIGIPEEISDRIFDPFFTTKGKDRMGLGLSLSRAVIERHKGELEITTRKDQGTTFILKLPIKRKEKRKRATFLRRQIKNATILIISDEDLLRELLSQVLVTRGFRVVTVAGIPEGLNSVKRKGFDLIIIDYVSLEKGKDSMKEIKRRNRGKPVALLTA